MRGYVLVRTQSGAEKEVVRLVRQTPGVVRADATFGPYDVIVELEAPDLSAVGRLVTDQIRTTPGVVDTLTCLVVDA